MNLRPNHLPQEELCKEDQIYPPDHPENEEGLQPKGQDRPVGKARGTPELQNHPHGNEQYDKVYNRKKHCGYKSRESMNSDNSG